MEVIIAVLLCVVGFLLYLLKQNRDEISRLKIELQQLHTQIPNNQPPLISEKTFVRVIFRKDDRRYYDYLLGNNPDVRIGDFVEVYASNKFDEMPASQLFIAQVIYISKPGEISEFAKSKIKRKSNRRKW